MNEYKEIKNRLKNAKRQRLEKYREVISPIDAEIEYLENKALEVCKHKNVKQETQSYEEAGRVKYFEWQQWVCQTCGKELTNQEYEYMVATQQGNYSI